MDSNHNAEPPYNIYLIDKMCRGNNEQIVKMVQVFVEDIEQSVKEINVAFTENDYSAIKKLTHKIKPTLTYFGVAKLEKQLLQIDTMLLQDFDANDLSLKLSKLTILKTEAVEAMKDDFNL